MRDIERVEFRRGEGVLLQGRMPKPALPVLQQTEGLFVPAARFRQCGKGFRNFQSTYLCRKFSGISRREPLSVWHPTFKSFIAQPGVQDYCCKMPAAQISLVLVKGTRSVGISKFEVVLGEAQRIVKTLPS